MKTITIVICLLLASSASAGSLKIPALTLLAAQSADIATTHAALTSGRGVEANQIMAGGMTKQIAMKAVSTSATLLLATKLQQHHPKLAAGMVYILAGSVGAIAIHNSRVGR